MLFNLSNVTEIWQKIRESIDVVKVDLQNIADPAPSTEKQRPRTEQVIDNPRCQTPKIRVFIIAMSEWKIKISRF